MKLCRTCRYGRMYELDKPCIVYRADCPMYQKVGDGMNREEAIKVLNMVEAHGLADEANRMAIKALENIGHLTDRPCDVCEFHGENGCAQWKCVFCDELFGSMR